MCSNDLCYKYFSLYFRRVEFKMTRVSKHDMRKILRNQGISFYDLVERKREILNIGCELNTLYKEDVLYIADENTSIISAENRMSQRRRDY